jgi:hypothetical protein
LTLRSGSALILALLASAGAARGDEGVLAFQTEDWTLESPAALGTQADLELSARQIQLCTDEVRRLVSHRPTNVKRFSWRWIVDGLRVAYAFPTGVESHVPDSEWRLVDDVARPFRQSLVARGMCFGPHEITHVLTWESWRMAWSNEGFATFTDWLYQSGSWRCCGAPLRLVNDCDDTGYTDGPSHRPYADLRRFSISNEMYSTAACFWREVHRRGGFPAIRRILMRLRSYVAATPGELVVNHVNPVLGIDFRPIARRYGFSDADLAAAGAAPPDPAPPTLILSTPRTSPAAPRGGQRVTATASVMRSDTRDPPAAATVRCPARLGRRALAATVGTFAAGRATCRWRTPPSARGLVLRGTVVVSYRGVSARGTVTVRLRP